MMTQASADNGQPDKHPRPAGPLHRWVLPIEPPRPVNPALIRHADQRAAYAQNRIADAITTFAGSMAFVYIHIVWFGRWIGLGVERCPFGLLTMIVSGGGHSRPPQRLFRARVTRRRAEPRRQRGGRCRLEGRINRRVWLLSNPVYLR